MRGRIAIRIAVGALFVFALMTLASLRMTYRDMRVELQTLQKQSVALDEANARLESDLTSDMDAGFIERIARERLGLCYPNEVLVFFYLGQ